MAMYSNTLQVLRHYLATRVGDNIFGQAGITGATTTKTYAPFLYQPNDFYNENFYEVYVYAGTNIGVTKRVTDWDLSTFLLTVHSAYSVACDATSYIELHKIFSTNEYNKAINLAIESLASRYLIDIDDATVVITRTAKHDDADSYIYTVEYALPTSLLHIHRVTLENGVSGKRLNSVISVAFVAGETVTGGTSGASGLVSYAPTAKTYLTVREISGTFVVGETLSGSASGVGGAITSIDDITAGDGRYLNDDVIESEDYYIHKAYTADIVFDDGLLESSAVDRHLRIEGQGAQDLLTADTHICYLPPDWIVAKAITFLPYSKVESANLAQTFAVAERQSALMPYKPAYPRARRVVE